MQVSRRWIDCCLPDRFDRLFAFGRWADRATRRGIHFDHADLPAHAERPASGDSRHLADRTVSIAEFGFRVSDAGWTDGRADADRRSCSNHARGGAAETDSTPE